MNNCRCCQKRIEGKSLYHPECLRKLFGTTTLPLVPFGVNDLSKLIATYQGRMSISGIQIKASVKLDTGLKQLEVVAVGGTHILKPDPQRLPELPINENLCMSMAETVGLPVPPHGLFSMTDSSMCYVIKRFDRMENGDKLQEETLFQLLDFRQKYEGSLEKVGKTLQKYTTQVGLQLIDFFERVLFCFLIGNGDMHLKNWAVLRQNGEVVLAPCFDLVSSKIYLDNEDETALSLNGKFNKLRRSDFEAFGSYLKLAPKTISNIFQKYEVSQNQLLEMCSKSELNADLKEKLKEVIANRYQQIFL
ncbi:MAG: HipA domain-containing protein [Verrucomicrobia bacterium]|nr:HipA domain-containing protein [Verrucomicrobiota bacterium]